MKKLILSLTIIASLTSCDRSYPKIGDPVQPFIVKEIQDIGDGWCKYTGNPHATVDYDPFNHYPVLILPVGMFNVRDTIKINNLKSWQRF